MCQSLIFYPKLQKERFRLTYKHICNIAEKFQQILINPLVINIPFSKQDNIIYKQEMSNMYQSIDLYTYQSSYQRFFSILLLKPSPIKRNKRVEKGQPFLRPLELLNFLQKLHSLSKICRTHTPHDKIYCLQVRSNLQQNKFEKK